MTLLLALTLSLSWDPLPPEANIATLSATAWVWVPTFYACTDPDTGEPGTCLAGYVETWRETVTVPGSATSLTWTVPDFPSGAVAYYPIEVRACRADGCCSDGGAPEGANLAVPEAQEPAP
jgi:hypothetical protein